MNDKNKTARSTQDVNSKRKRVTIDEQGKPVKKGDSKDSNPVNYKPSSLKEEH